MLTGPLQLAFYRQGKAFPKKLAVDAANLGLAEELLLLIQGNQGRPRAEVEEELKSLDRQAQQPLVLKGLAKLVLDQSDFSSLTGDMDQVRAQLYDAAAAYWRGKSPWTGDLDQVQRNILTQAGLTPVGPVEAWAYGDLPAHQKLIQSPGWGPEELIHRYNLAQAQGLVMQADNLDITLSKPSQAAFRQVMGYLKFFGLLFTLLQEDSQTLRLRVDGPHQLLENGRSYGVELANFFAALLLLPGPWTMEAPLRRKGIARGFVFHLDHQHGYQSPFRANGIWQQHKLLELQAHFNAKYGPHCRLDLVTKVIPLKGMLRLIPDLTVQGPQGQIEVEWLRFVTPQKEAWLQEVAPLAPANYVFACKAKGAAKADWEARLGSRVLCFATELTAKALHQRVSE